MALETIGINFNRSIITEDHSSVGIFVRRGITAVLWWHSRGTLEKFVLSALILNDCNIFSMPFCESFIFCGIVYYKL